MRPTILGCSSGRGPSSSSSLSHTLFSEGYSYVLCRLDSLKEMFSFFASGSRLDQAGFGERLVSSNNLYVLHSRVALLQEGSQLGVGGLGRRKSRRCLGCSVRLRFGRSWLGLLLGLGPTFGHHSERVPLPPVHQRAWGRHSLGQLHFNIIDVCDGKLFA